MHGMKDNILFKGVEYKGCSSNSITPSAIYVSINPSSLCNAAFLDKLSSVFTESLSPPSGSSGSV
jgi:hypothetical protein